MKLWQILVPTVRNDGGFFRLKHHRLWDEKVRSIAGGLTIMTPTKGQWLSSSGELFTERMIPVQIACSKDDIEHIADLTARHYHQQAVMYWLVSSEVHIKHYPVATPAANAS
jgi:hypothetical protein